MGLLDMFMGGDPNRPPGASDPLSFLPEAGSASSNNLLDVGQALGMSLLQGNRQQPFANVAQNLAAVSQMGRSGTTKSALKALLIQAGYSDVEAEKLSSSEGVAKLAIQQKQQQKLLGDGGDSEPSLFGGGAPSGAPAISPAAPPGPAAGASMNGGTGGLTGSQAEKAQAWYSEAIKQGATPLEAAAMVGNYTVENGLNTSGKPGDNGTAFGGGQWREERAANLRKLAQDRGESWDSVPVQVAHTLNELKGGDAGAERARALIAQAKTPEEAAGIFAQHFERPHKDALAATIGQRAGAAAQAYRMFGQGAPTQVADASGQVGAPTVSPADLPATDAQPAGFVIPPGAQAAVEKQVGAPPTPVNPNIGPTTQRAQAIANFNYWGKRLRASAAFGEAGKGLMEEAKIKMSLASEFLKQPEAEKLADAAGLQGEDRQRALAGAISGNSDTSMQKEYNTYRKQEAAAGRTPLSQFEYDVALSKAKAASTKVEIGGEKSYDQGQGKQYSDVMTEVQGAGRKAPALIATLNQAEKLMSTPGFVSGLGSTFALPAKQVIAALGGDAKAPASMERFRSLSNRAVTDALGGSLGAGVSNADVSFLQKQVASLDNSVEGNKQIIASARRVAEHQRKIAAFANDYADQNGGRLDRGFDRALSAWADRNPIFSEEERGGAPRQSAQPTMPTGNTTERAGFITQSRAAAAAALAKRPEARDAILKRLKDAGVYTDGL